MYDLNYLRMINNGYDPMLILGKYGKGGLMYSHPNIIGDGVYKTKEEEQQELEDKQEISELNEEFYNYVIQINKIMEEIDKTEVPEEKEILKKKKLKLWNEANSLLSKIGKTKEENTLNKLQFTLGRAKSLYKKTPSSKNKSNYKQALEDIIKYSNENPTIFDEQDKQDFVDEINDLIIKGGIYEVDDEGNIVKTEQQKGDYKFEKGMTTNDAIKEIDKYWEDNDEAILETDEDNESVINEIIEEILDSQDDLFDEYIEIPDMVQSMKLFNNYTQEQAKKYLETVVIDDEALTPDRITKELNSAGKVLEFAICGKNNILANKLYGNLKNSSFVVSDFLIEDIFKTQVLPELNKLKSKTSGLKVPTGSGGIYYCHDNINKGSKIINEAKKYDDIKYMSMYNTSIDHKKVYYNKKISILKNLIKVYRTAFDEDILEDILDEIKNLRKILIDKDEFDKDYYKNERYLGIGITMNKFNPIEIPDDIDDLPNTLEQIKEVQSNQKQKFAPIMKDRKIVSTISTTGQEAVKKVYNKAIQDTIFKEGNKNIKYDFNITVLFDTGLNSEQKAKHGTNKCFGVYNYSEDELVDNDFILGTYKTSYSHDDRGRAVYNGVLIPIEKFILKK